MTYIDRRYINCARESEIRHHERTIAHLRIKIDKLIKELSWELDQHHSRLKELQRLEEVEEKGALGRRVSSTPYSSSMQQERASRFPTVFPDTGMPQLVK